jgi:hypothetical protein
MPLVLGTHLAKKKSDDSWQKVAASSANSKDICLEAAQRNQVGRMPPPVPDLHIAPHLLQEYKLPEQMTKKPLSPPPNRRKGLTM